MARKKVNKLKQAHGKDEKSSAASTLDQIWGDTGLSKYKTLDGNKYQEYIRGLNRSDLQRHATEMGIVPVDNREMLSNRLMREFKKHVASYVIPKTMDTNKGVSEEAKNILSEGR